MLEEYGISHKDNSFAKKGREQTLRPKGPTNKTFRPNKEYAAGVIFPVRDEHATPIARGLNPWIPLLQKEGKNATQTGEIPDTELLGIIASVDATPPDMRTGQEKSARRRSVIELSRRDMSFPWREIWEESSQATAGYFE